MYNFITINNNLPFLDYNYSFILSDIIIKYYKLRGHNIILKAFNNQIIFNNNIIDLLIRNDDVEYHNSGDTKDYIFRLSKYQDRIIDYITKNSHYIQPSNIRDSILSKLQSSKLQDILIMRKINNWYVGIPNNSLFKINNLEIIRYDNCWIYGVILTGLLMALNYNLPETILCHGFINYNGSPAELKKYKNDDCLRLHLISDIGYDISFSEEILKNGYNIDICDTLGKILNRIINLIKKYNSSIIPDVKYYELFSLNEMINCLDTYFEKFEINTAYEYIITKVQDVDKYLDFNEPDKQLNTNIRDKILKTAIETMYLLIHLLYPFIPNTVLKILSSFNIQLKILNDDNISDNNMLGFIDNVNFNKII